MPFDTDTAQTLAPAPVIALRREDRAMIRTALRRLDPGQSVTLDWPVDRNRGEFRQDILAAGRALWGARMVSAVPVTFGCMVTRHA